MQTKDTGILSLFLSFQIHCPLTNVIICTIPSLRLRGPKFGRVKLNRNSSYSVKMQAISDLGKLLL